MRYDGAMGNHKERSLYKGLILYGDDETHKKAMELIEKNYVYKGILHDKDKDKDGKLKKPHYHYIVKMSSTCPNSTLASNLQIEENYIQIIRSLKGAYNYLTHKYDKDKFQYENIEMFGDLDIDIDEKIDGDFQCLIKSIKTNQIKTMYELTFWAIENNCLKTLKQNAYLFSQILKANS